MVLLMTLLACGTGGRGPAGSDGTETDTTGLDAPTSVVPGDGVFAEGCPAPGRSLARVIGVDATLPGEAAVGTRGDLLLANTHAAFVITDAVGQSTYWYYGGALADAATMDGCDPGTDKLDELGFVVASLNLLEVTRSVVRCFRADTLEVLADGSDGGPAIVRASGTDDTHWLVEHTLINEAADAGDRRPPSGPLGTAITVDYILAPDSPVLEMAITIENVGDARFTLVEAALLQYGETLDPILYATDDLSLGGFNFQAGMPWILATDGEGAYAYGATDASLALVQLSGVNVAADVAQLTDGFSLNPGESATVRRFLAVGDGGGSTATEPLLEVVGEPLLDRPAIPARIGGTLQDPAGNPVRAAVRIQARAPGAGWGDLDRVPTDEDGRFVAMLPKFDDAWDFRVVGDDPARDAPAPVDVTPGATTVEVPIGPRGQVSITARDAEGAPIPARVVFVRDDGLRRDVWIAASEAVDLPPGHWTWTATRGYEYAPDRGEVLVPDDGSATLQAALAHVVDTTGWMSIDTHVHTSDSPDSDVDQAEQLLRGAAHGLDIVLHTEHEHIVDRRTVPAEAGLDGWVNNAIGEEVTSIGVEHMTMFPVEPDGSPRGGYVEWYGLDIAQLFGAMRDRSGGGINLLNHPSYLDRIGWNRVTASPTLDDPTLIGLTADQALWSWDFDGMEVMNGHSNIFATGNRRFDNWMSMVNAGRPMVAVGCSDDHGGWETGFPRTYFASRTDLPESFDVDEAVDAFRGGRVIASAGAFARVEVDGAGPGGLVTDTDGLVDLHVRIEALPEVDVTHFVVFANCDQVDSVRVTAPDGVEKHDGTVTVEAIGDTQIVIAALGTTKLPLGLPQYDATKVPRVLTSPIYVDGDGDGVFSAPGGRECTYDLSVAAAR